MTMDTDSDRQLYSEYQCRICKAIVPLDDATGLLSDGSCEACGSCYRRLAERADAIAWIAELEQAATNGATQHFTSGDGMPDDYSAYGYPREWPTEPTTPELPDGLTEGGG